MTIRVWDYRVEYEAERDDLLDAVDTVFRSGRLILGESVRRFEEEFAAFCGVPHGVGVDNATNGLFLALRALSIGPGDEVLTVANTAVPTVAAIVAAGATPRFVDIDPRTYLMDVSRLDGVITPHTKCILPVHLYGQCAAMETVRDIADRRGLMVIEDCAQAHGARRADKPAGSMSNAGVFSFYPTKLLGAYGDGGMVVTGDSTAAARLRRLRFYGMDETYYALEDGYNSRLDEVQAEILRRKLTRLGGYLTRRRALALRYDALLAGLELQLPRTLPGNEHAYYLYVVRHPSRDRILSMLRERDIELNVSYPWPIHAMPAYQRLGYRVGDLPHTEAAAQEVFSLPMYPSLADADVDRVCDELHRVLRQVGRD